MFGSFIKLEFTSKESEGQRTAAFGAPPLWRRIHGREVVTTDSVMESPPHTTVTKDAEAVAPAKLSDRTVAQANLSMGLKRWRAAAMRRNSSGSPERGSRWRTMMFITKVRKKMIVWGVERWRSSAAEERIRSMRGAMRAAAYWRGGLLAAAFFDWRQMWYKGMIENATSKQAAHAWHRLSRHSCARVFEVWAAVVASSSTSHRRMQAALERWRIGAVSWAFRAWAAAAANSSSTLRRMQTALERWRFSAASWAIHRLWDERERGRRVQEKEKARLAAEAEAAAKRRAAETERVRLAAEAAEAQRAAEEERERRVQRAEEERRAEYERRAKERAEQLRLVESAWAVAAAAAEEAARAQHEVEMLTLFRSVNAAAAEEISHRERLVDSWSAIPPIHFISAPASVTSSPASFRSSQRATRRAHSPSLLPASAASFHLGHMERTDGGRASPTRETRARPIGTPPPRPPPSRKPAKSDELAPVEREGYLMEEIWSQTRLFCEEMSASPRHPDSAARGLTWA